MTVHQRRTHFICSTDLRWYYGEMGFGSQGPVRARVLNDLSDEEKERYKADIRDQYLLQGDSGRNKAMVQDGKVVVQDVHGRNNANNPGMDISEKQCRGNGVAGKRWCSTGRRIVLFLAGEQVTNFDDGVDESPR
ncbi:hypothetical protein Tco_0908311 [Tanacetum coccineum]|uniref:Uncharacterized protein n=1 Tax=Tanacetum coccineum TaxID=301880 RepID=A0ABQ5CQ88_9ASTR